MTSTRYRPYPDYKDSGSEWLGRIPAHWEARRLKHLATTNDEVLPENANSDYELSYIDIGNVDATEGIVAHERYTFAEAPSRARRIVRDGDVIVSTVRTYLRAIAPIVKPEPNLIVSTGFAVIRPRSGLLSSFAAYALQAPYFVDHVVAESVGVSYPAITAWQLGTFCIGVPAEEEQQAIADFLDSETSKIDALVEKKERLIELLQEKRTALITHAVTKGLDPNVPMKDSGIEWLGQIPGHWARSAIKHLAIFSGKTFVDGDWIETPFITDEGIRLIQCGNVGTGRYEEQGYRYISEETFRGFGCTEVSPGDILICRLQSSPRILAGRACLAPDLGVRMITSIDNCILKVRKGIEARYVVYQLSTSAYLNYIHAISRGGTRPRISRAMLGQIDVIVPPVEEQREIADSLDRETAKIDARIAKIQEAIERLKEYRTALISAAVTGKIDVRNEVTV